MSEPFEEQRVYFVESEEDPTVLLARSPGFREGFVLWDDTVRERALPVVDWRREGEAIVVRSERGASYRFLPLTLEIYEEHVQHLVELSPSFASTEELQAFYRGASF